MWISSAPLRISLAGGGTDLPSYAGRFGGVVLGTSTDLRVTVVGRPGRTATGIRACLDSCTVSGTTEGMANPFAGAALARHWDGGAIELASFGDVPGGTGMGSSAAFCVALIGGLTGGQGPRERELAEAAAAIETEALRRAVGKQDHYLSALGGFRRMHFGRDGSVEVETLVLDEEVVQRLDDELLLFFTGVTRDADRVLAAQGDRVRAGDRAVERALHEIKELADLALDALLAGDTGCLGRVLGRHWEAKRSLGSGVSLPLVDRAYREALAAGATGGKLIGAGGGGFLLLHVPPREQAEVRAVLAGHGLVEQAFGLDGRGHELAFVGHEPAFPGPGAVR